MSLADESSSKRAQAQAIVEQVIARRRRGELLSDEEVLQRHPELLGTLESLLRKAAKLESLRPQQHPLEQLLQQLNTDPHLSAEEDVAATGNAESLSLASVPDLFPVANAPDELDAKSGPRITLDGGVSSVERNPDRSPSTNPASDGDAHSSHLTWNEPSEADEEPTANLHQARAKKDTQRFRPTIRAPMALLTLVDDGRLDGRVVRLTAAQTIIGREGADVVAPHDGMMSAIHARINRKRESRDWRWILEDLGSTNGVFIKAKKVRLRDGDQLLLGSRLVQFSQSQDEPAAATRLNEVTPSGGGKSLQLTGDEQWLGRDVSLCGVFLAGDAMLEQHAARMQREPGGRWTIDSNASVNGMWVRVQQITLQNGSMFQLGEQRFRFHAP